jgi:antitoxin MazE
MVDQWYTFGIPLGWRIDMIKNFVKHGNNWAIVIDRPILDLLKINPESEIELTTDGQSIRIAPADPMSEKSKVRAASEKVNAKHSRAFRKLAE